MKDLKITQKRNNKGISLISLVITIIVMLILATIIIVVLNTENNLIFRSKGTKIETIETNI